MPGWGGGVGWGVVARILRFGYHPGSVSQRELDDLMVDSPESPGLRNAVYEYVLRASAARSFSMASLNSMVENGANMYTRYKLIA